MKVACTVLRGGGSSDAASLPDTEGGAKRSKLEVVVNQLHLMPRNGKNGNGTDSGAGEFDGTIPTPEEDAIPF